MTFYLFYAVKSMLSLKINLFTSVISKVFKFTQHCLHCIKKVKNQRLISKKFKITNSDPKSLSYQKSISESLRHFCCVFQPLFWGENLFVIGFNDPDFTTVSLKHSTLIGALEFYCIYFSFCWLLLYSVLFLYHQAFTQSGFFTQRKPLKKVKIW